MANSGLKNRFLSQLDPTEARANRAEDFYLDKATSFDPSAALDRYAGGVTSRLRRDIGRDVDTLRGQQVGMGRLDTGFATEDEDRVVTDLGERAQEDLDRAALQTTGMDMQNYQNVGQYGQNTRNTFLDLMSGGLDRETAEANAKRQMWASIVSGLTGVAGAAVGGGGLFGKVAGVVK